MSSKSDTSPHGGGGGSPRGSGLWQCSDRPMAILHNADGAGLDSVGGKGERAVTGAKEGRERGRGAFVMLSVNVVRQLRKGVLSTGYGS